MMNFFQWFRACLACDFTTVLSCSASKQQLCLCLTIMGVGERGQGGVSVKRVFCLFVGCGRITAAESTKQ